MFPAEKDAMLKTQDYLILGAALVSFLFSVSLWFGLMGPADKDAGLYVGLWVPSILATASYLARRVERR